MPARRRWGRHRGPSIIAHRGASHAALENTLAAFARARDEGADGIELDVVRCASGEVVVFHDDDLGRLAGRPERLRETPWSVLAEVDLGGGRIPLLAEVLRASEGLLVNVELKSDARRWWRDDGLARETARLLLGDRSPERFLVSSFDPLLLGRFRRAAPEVATGLLLDPDAARPLREGWAAQVLCPMALHPAAALASPQAVARWRRQGHLVHVWTVDDPLEARALAATGVDALITNEPAIARAAVDGLFRGGAWGA